MTTADAYQGMTDDEVRETGLAHLRQAEALTHTQGSAGWLAEVDKYETTRAELERRDIARTLARLAQLDAQPGHPPPAG